MPERVQIRRDRSWQDPQNKAIVVDRRTEFGNPFKVGMHITLRYPTGRRVAVFVRDLGHAVALHSDWMADLFEIPGTQRPSRDEIATRLGGHNLACWCPPERACHADILIELANAPTKETHR